MKLTSDPKSLRRLAVAVVLALLAVWGLGFIWRTSFVLAGQRTFCLFDDAMISMTYARNLLAGQGLEWARQGAPVEGFTHPLWLAAMLPANLPFLPLPWRSLPIQLLSLVLLGATAMAVKRLIEEGFAGPAVRQWLPAMALTAFYYPLAYWSLMGMESALQALLTLIALRLALAITERGEDRHRALWLVCAAAYLLRMDLLLLVVVVQGWVMVRGRLWRTESREGRAHWAQGLALFVAAGLGYELFRVLYFHSPLPNTYYLKLTGIPLDVRLERGIATLSAFASGVWPLLLAGFLAAAFLLLRDRRALPLTAIVLLAFAYDVWIGGDAWELTGQAIGVAANRFLAPVMPVLFVLICLAFDRLLAAWTAHSPRLAGPVPTAALAALLALALFASANDLLHSGSAEGHLRQLALLDPPPNRDRELEVFDDLERFEQLVSPNAVVATAWAGIPAFFTDYRMVDILGYNDSVVARLPSVIPLSRDTWRRYVPGHVKWDQHRLLTEQRPDAFFQTWGGKKTGRNREVLPAAGYRFFHRFWVRADSPFVHPQSGPPLDGLATLAAPHRNPHHWHSPTPAS